MHHGCQAPTKVFLIKRFLLSGPSKIFLLKTTVARFKQSSLQLYASWLSGPEKGFFFIKEILLSGPRKVFRPIAIVAGSRKDTLFCCKILAGNTLGVGVSLRMGTYSNNREYKHISGARRHRTLFVLNEN